MASEAQEATCHLCCLTASAAPLYRVCACDQCVHEECFRRLLLVPSHNIKCPVCCEDYNVSIVWKERLRWTGRRSMLICGAVCMNILLSVGLIWCGLAAPQIYRCTDCVLVVVSAFVAAAIGLIAILLIIAMHFSAYRTVMCCTLKKTIVRHTFSADTITWNDQI